jgi:hypothetical protein
MSDKRTILLLTFLGALACAPIAYAAPEGATKTATAAMLPGEKKALPEGFEPISGKEKKTEVDPNPLVVGAYAVFFVCMFGYMIFIARSQAGIAKEMQDLSERIKRTEKK